MRGLLKTGAVLLAPALAGAVALEQDSIPSAFITLHLADSADDSRSSTHDLVFRLDILESTEACGYSNVTINGQALPEGGSGSFTVDGDRVMDASWNTTCVAWDDVAQEQLLSLNVDLINGLPVDEVGFTVRFQQVAPVWISDVEGTASMTRIHSVNQAKPHCDEDGEEEVDVEAELAELDLLHWQVSELRQQIEIRERRLAKAFGWSSSGRPPMIEDCDSLRCVVKTLYHKVKGAASSFGFAGFPEGPHGPHGPHGNPRRPQGDREANAHGQEHRPSRQGHKGHSKNGTEPHPPAHHGHPPPFCKCAPPPPSHHGHGEGPPHPHGPPPPFEDEHAHMPHPPHPHGQSFEGHQAPRPHGPPFEDEFAHMPPPSHPHGPFEEEHAHMPPPHHPHGPGPEEQHHGHMPPPPPESFPPHPPHRGPASGHMPRPGMGPDEAFQPSGPGHKKPEPQDAPEFDEHDSEDDMPIEEGPFSEAELRRDFEHEGEHGAHRPPPPPPPPHMHDGPDSFDDDMPMPPHPPPPHFDLDGTPIPPPPPPPGAPHGGPPGPPHGPALIPIASAASSIVLLGIFLSVLCQRCARRSDGSSSRWAQSRRRSYSSAPWYKKLCFGPHYQALDDEEKEAMLRDCDSDCSSVQGDEPTPAVSSPTFRPAGEVVGEMVEQQQQQQQQQMMYSHSRHSSQASSIPVPVMGMPMPMPMPMPVPMGMAMAVPMSISEEAAAMFPDLHTTEEDEALPAYQEAQRVESEDDASELASSLMADGYRPGSGSYTPSESGSQGASDILGPVKN